MIKDQFTKGQGFVSIVGAGPGPVDLMTLRALDRLQRAEVVVHDRLISPEVLALIPSTAQRLYVGKSLGNHSVPQVQIHALLVQHAKLGKRVVRLKGGDPYIFGRGGEEVQALQTEGISFEVVPGVTSASGGSAAAGIPLTHRDLAASCVFLPGHLANDNATHDWAALARPGQTRVFYMGVQRLAQIAKLLISHGLPSGGAGTVLWPSTRPAHHWRNCAVEPGLQNALKAGHSLRANKMVVLLTPRTQALKPHFLGWFVFINSFANQSEANVWVGGTSLNWIFRNLPFAEVGYRL